MLEQKIEALTAAVMALTAQVVGLNQAASPALAQPAPTFSAPAPQATPSFGGAPAGLTNGMPGGPSFGGAPVQPVAPTGPVAPFSDQKGMADYTMSVFGAIEQKRPGTGEALVNSLLTHLCGSASINDLPAAKYGEFYAEMERQRAA